MATDGRLDPRHLSATGATHGMVPTAKGSGHKPTWGPLYPAALIKSGTAAVASDVFVPGLLIVEDGILTQLGVTTRTAPTGADLIVVFKLARTGSTIGTVTVAASSNAGVEDIADFAVLQGDLIKTDITQVGSTVAGSDVVAWAREIT